MKNESTPSRPLTYATGYVHTGFNKPVAMSLHSYSLRKGKASVETQDYEK